MPVIIVGADTELGSSIARGFDPHRREVRVFVSDPLVGEQLKQRGYKVAVGDVSDASHVGGAATRAFSAVLIADATRDERERSFAGSPELVVKTWADALSEAGVQRVIWVDTQAEPGLPPSLADAAAEVASVGAADRDDEVVQAVIALDETAELT